MRAYCMMTGAVILAICAADMCEAQQRAKRRIIKRPELTQFSNVDLESLKVSELASGRYKDMTSAEKTVLLANMPHRYAWRGQRAPRRVQRSGVAANGLRYFIWDGNPNLPDNHVGEPETEGAADDLVVCSTTPIQKAKMFFRPLVTDASNNPNQPVIRPGALFKDEDVVRGLFTPVLLKRSPGTFYIDVQNNGGAISQPIADMNDSTKVAEAINALRTQVQNSYVNAYIEYQAAEFSAESQLNLDLTASVDANLTALVEFPLQVAGGVEGSVAVANAMNVAVASLHQVYYTISVGGSGPASTISENIPGSVVCVTDVQYGRLAFLTLGSYTSRSEAHATLDELIRVGLDEDLSLAEANAALSAAAKSALSAGLFKIKIIGGDVAQAVTVNNLQSFRNYVEQIDPSVAGAHAVPISYTLRYASDNALAKIGAYADYEDRECWKATGLKVTLKTITPTKVVDFGDEELYGSVRVAPMGNKVSGSRTLWSRSWSNWKTGKEGVPINVDTSVTIHINPRIHPVSSVDIEVNLKDRVMNDPEWAGASNAARDNGYVRYTPRTFSVPLDDIPLNGTLNRTFTLSEGSDAEVKLAMQFTLFNPAINP